MKKNGKYCNGKKSLNMKPLALLLALTLLVGCAVGGTLAWLTANTTPVQNTFSASDITITLQEHEYDPENDALTQSVTTTGVTNYKMVPGWTIPKDPWATVSATSEDCFLFVKVTRVNNFSKFMEYGVNDAWTKLDSACETDFDVYYIEIDTAAEKGVNHPVLVDNKVAVKSSITKTDMALVSENAKPALSFTAYAVQLWKTNKPADLTDTAAVEAAKFSPADAWDLAKNLT